MDFATSNEIVIANTLFEQHRHRLYTWTSPDGNTRNQIDYFCIHERWKTSVVNTNTLPGADCGSDHELSMMSMRLKIKKTKAAKHPIRYDMIHFPEQFNVDIKNRFAELIIILVLPPGVVCQSNCVLPMPGTADGDVVSRCQVLGRAGSVHHGTDH